MYIPKNFRNENIEDVKDFIKENSFGVLVGNALNKLHATHLPFTLTKANDGHDILTSHLSRANPQLKHIVEGEEVLVIFQGPHSYISSSWYDHVNVPTWNYIAVHVYGKIRIIEGEELYQSLKSLVDKYEKDSKKPISMEGMGEEFLKKETKGVVGFEIRIDSIQAAYKLSQNRDDKNFKNIVNELQEKSDPNSNAIAKEMKKLRPNI